jgi:hypothetical protein
MGKESTMLTLPKAVEWVLSPLSVAFTKPTFQRIRVLCVGSVLTMGRHTVTAALRVLRSLAPGHHTDYHRVFSRAAWSLWPLARVLAAMVLELVPADQAVLCTVDDTTPQHKGKCVWGKDRHRDNCRSTRSHTVWAFGHKWVVLAINVKFFFARRPWALPVLVALYRTAELDQKQGRRHKTPIELARGLMATLLHWFPQRRFILLGDGGYASHELARFCHRHRRRLTLVSLCPARANLYTLPPKHKARIGRPRVKGDKLPSPQEEVAANKRHKSVVGWYGGQKRHIEFVSGSGYWYKAGQGLVPIRWVFVHDLDGTHEDRYFYSTDVSFSASKIVTLYTTRWSIEVSFEEVRLHLGFHTPRCWAKNSVLRMGPCLLGLFSLVCLIYHRQTRGQGTRPAATAWYAKAEVSFADAIATVRGLLWQTVLQQVDQQQAFQKLPPKLRRILLEQLSLAA